MERLSWITEAFPDHNLVYYLLWKRLGDSARKWEDQKGKRSFWWRLYRHSAPEGIIPSGLLPFYKPGTTEHRLKAIRTPSNGDDTLVFWFYKTALCSPGWPCALNPPASVSRWLTRQELQGATTPGRFQNVVTLVHAANRKMILDLKASKA